MHVANILNWIITSLEKKVALGLIHTRFVASHQQHADILMKALSRNQFEVLRFKLGVQPLALPSLRGRINGPTNHDRLEFVT